MIESLRTKFFLLIILILFLASTFAVLVPKKVGAVTGTDWKPGRIIDDAIFFNKDSMNTTQIQQFLNAKVPVCDTNHNASFWLYGYWNAPPYTCIKDYSENGKSAAQIIWEAGQNYGINPQVLLVILQRESAIITDTWAAPWQYKRATGYRCPDSALGTDVDANQNGCYDQYESFTAQVNGAAYRLRDYVNNPYSYNFQAGVTRNILWNVASTNCGSAPVYIETQGTAALYNYTPYQPNQAALNNLYGSGDGCSAYGNRNFWRMFNDWFGSSTAFNASITLSKSLTVTSGVPAQTFSPITASFDITNNADYPVNVGGVGVCARLNGYNFDFGFDHSVILQARQTLTISKSRIMNEAGDLRIFVCSYNENLGGFASDVYPYTFNGNTIRSLQLAILDNPLISSGISLSPSTPSIGQPVTATMTLKNNGTTPVNVGSMVIAVRDPNGSNLDFGIVNDFIVPAGGTYTYSKTQTFTTPGTYSMFIANWNGVWSTSFPKPADSSVDRSITKLIQ